MEPLPGWEPPLWSPAPKADALSLVSHLKRQWPGLPSRAPCPCPCPWVCPAPPFLPRACPGPALPPLPGGDPSKAPFPEGIQRPAPRHLVTSHTQDSVSQLPCPHRLSQPPTRSSLTTGGGSDRQESHDPHRRRWPRRPRPHRGGRRGPHCSEGSGSCPWPGALRWARGSPDPSPCDGPVTARAPSRASLPVCPAGLERAPSLPAPGLRGPAQGSRAPRGGLGRRRAGLPRGPDPALVSRGRPRLSGCSVDRGPSPRLCCAQGCRPGGPRTPIGPSAPPAGPVPPAPGVLPPRPGGALMQRRGVPGGDPVLPQVHARWVPPHGGHGRGTLLLLPRPGAPLFTAPPSVGGVELLGTEGVRPRTPAPAAGPRLPCTGEGLQQSQDSGSRGPHPRPGSSH